MSNCTLLPGVFGIFIQLFLALVSLTTILVKYAFENPRRKLSVFMQDLAQLICGSTCVHVLNMISSILINKYTKTGSHHDECNLYFMTTVFDATIGIYLEYKIARIIVIRQTAREYLKLTRKSTFAPKWFEVDHARTLASNAIKKKFHQLKFWSAKEKELGASPEINYPYQHENAKEDEPLIPNEAEKPSTTNIFNFLESSNKQEFQYNLVNWLIVVSAAKTITLIMLVLFSTQLNDLAAWLLKSFESSDRCKLVFVMIGAPLFFNVLQYYLTDCILKVKHITPFDLCNSDVNEAPI